MKIQIRDKFPHLKNVLPESVPDENVIECEKKKSVKTIYQLDYSKEGFEKGSLYLCYIITHTHICMYACAYIVALRLSFCNTCIHRKFPVLIIFISLETWNIIYEHKYLVLFNYLISQYHNIYCVIINKYFRSQSDYQRKKITLPQNWIIPETIQRRAYRNPWIIVTRNIIKPSKIFKPRNNLDPNPKEREILCVTYVKYAQFIHIKQFQRFQKIFFLCRTGNSEYADTIGIVGERIKLQSPSDIKNHIRLRNY